MNSLTLSLSTMLLYIAASVSRVYAIRSPPFSPQQLLLLLGILAVALHSVVLYRALVTPMGLNLGIFNAASLVSWVIALLLVLTLPRKPVENLAITLFPIAACAIGLEWIFHTERILPIDRELIHILTSILAYSLLTISAFQALFLAIQDYQLHNKHPGWVMQRLPPLQVMETLLFQMIGIGFLLLSLSLLSGVLFLENLFTQHLVHKTILSLIAWSVFAMLLWGHWRYGWRGRTAIRWSLSGFFVLMLGYFGSKLVLELILQR